MTNEEDERKQKQAMDMLSRLKATEQQLNEQSKQENELVRTLNELTNAKTALEAIKNRKQGQKVLLPLSAGVYAYAEITNIDKVMIASGAGVMMDKTIPDTIDLFSDRINEVTEAIKQIRLTLSAMEQNYKNTADQLRSIQLTK